MKINVELELTSRQIRFLQTHCLGRTMAEACSELDDIDAEGDRLQHLEILSDNLKKASPIVEIMRFAITEAVADAERKQKAEAKARYAEKDIEAVYRRAEYDKLVREGLIPDILD